MTSAVVQRWVDILERGRTKELRELFDDNVVVYPPAAFPPQEGRAFALQFFKASAKNFRGSDFRYVEQWVGERSAALEFDSVVGGQPVNGVDIIHWNEDDKIVAVKMMLRPMGALQAVLPTIASEMRDS